MQKVIERQLRLNEETKKGAQITRKLYVRQYSKQVHYILVLRTDYWAYVGSMLSANAAKG